MVSFRTNAVVLPQARASAVLESVHMGEPGPGEVLLRMEACGLCHSDVFVTTLEKLPLAPVTLGHEGIGRVEKVGNGVTGWATGDRAGITFLGTTCGNCEWCTSGRERFCPKQTNFGYTLQGALSDYVIAPAAALVRVPEDLPAEVAAPLCCAGWTAYRALHEAALETGQSVALYGYGGLGHLALQMVDTVLKGITIKGSYLGSRDDLAAVFELAAQGVLKPHVHTHGLAEAPALLDQLRRGELPGRAVVRW